MVTNEKTDKVIFVYPDLVTALLANINTQTGLAEEDLTVCQISSLGIESGILVPGLIKCGQSVPVTKSNNKPRIFLKSFNYYFLCRHFQYCREVSRSM